MPERHSSSTIDHAASEIFLSPRVVDQRSFEEFSTLLKALVKDAANQSRTLATTTGEVRSLSQQLREATKELQARVETAVRVVPTLDQRVARAEQVLDRATTELTTREQSIRDLVSKEASLDRAALQRLVQDHLGSIVKDRLASFADDLAAAARSSHASLKGEIEQSLSRLDASKRALGADAAALEARLAAALQHAQEHAERLRADLDAKASALAALADDAAKTHVDALASRIDAAIHDRLDASKQSLDAWMASVEARLADHEQRGAERLAKAADQARERVAEVLHDLVAGVHALEQRAADASASLDARLAAFKNEARETLQALAEDANQQLEQSLNTSPAASLRDEVRALVATLTQSTAESRATVARAEEVACAIDQASERAAAAHADLTGLLQRSAANIADLEQRLDQARRGQDLLRNALSEAMVKAQEIDLSLDAHTTQQRESLERLAKPVLDDAAAQVRQMGQWLSQLLQEAAVAAKALEAAAKRPAP